MKKVKYVVEPGVFMDPGLTDSQGQPCKFKYKSTAWGGHIVYPEFYGSTQFDYCVFSGDAYKRFLSWLVGK